MVHSVYLLQSDIEVVLNLWIIATLSVQNKRPMFCDAVLFSADASECSIVLESYEEAAITVRMHYNWQKTNTQNIGTVPAPLSVHTDS